MKISFLLLKRALSIWALKNLYVNRINFLFSVYIKIFLHKNCFLYINKITMTAISETKSARSYIYKKQKNHKMLLYTKSQTLCKSKTVSVTFIYIKQDTLRHPIFQFFEVGIYIQKAWYLALRYVFIYKNPGNSQKAGKCALIL